MPSLHEYTINYKGGATQTITCTGPVSQGEWLVFADGSGEIMRVRAEGVVSVTREGTPEPTKSAPKVATA
jgi:hypothetical protein